MPMTSEEAMIMNQIANNQVRISEALVSLTEDFKNAGICVNVIGEKMKQFDEMIQNHHELIFRQRDKILKLEQKIQNLENYILSSQGINPDQFSISEE